MRTTIEIHVGPIWREFGKPMEERITSQSSANEIRCFDFLVSIHQFSFPSYGLFAPKRQAMWCLTKASTHVIAKLVWVYSMGNKSSRILSDVTNKLEV